MKKSVFIWTCIICMAAGGSFPLSGQQAISAERMILAGTAAEPDSLTSGIEVSPSEPSSAIIPVSGPGAGIPVSPVLEGNEPVRTNTDEADVEAGKRVERIWEEIDQSTAGPQLPEQGKRISPWSFSTSVGTSFIAFPQIGSAMNMFAAPRLNYAAGERLAFHAGMTVGRTLPLSGLVTAGDMANGATPGSGMTNLSGYVAASYLLTENLVIHGSGSRNAFLVPVNGELQAIQFNDISLGATYNFGNFSIGATIHHSDAPVFGAPFGNGNSMYGAPLFW